MGELSPPERCSESLSGIFWLSQCLLWASAFKGMLEVLQCMDQSVKKRFSLSLRPSVISMDASIDI